MPLTHRQKDGIALAIQATALVNRLKKHANGDIEMSPTQIRAAEILLDRALPKLSAVEQTVIDPAASMSEAEILAQITDLVKKYPHVLRQLKQMQLGPADDAAHKGDADDNGQTKAA